MLQYSIISFLVPNIQSHSPSPPPTLPPPTSFTNYTVTNMSHLPENVSVALRALDRDYVDGDLTQKGYLKRRAVLLEPFKNLVSINGSISFGVERIKQEDEVGGRGPVGGARKLLSFEGDGEGEELRLAEMVTIAKRKELNRERDLQKAVEEWERRHGTWVSDEEWEWRHGTWVSDGSSTSLVPTPLPPFKCYR